MQGSIIEEDSKNQKTNQTNKQKEKEISAIRVSIVQYHLSKFCKANATALALIFKALLRGEAIYPKVQFFQDLNTGRLLCQNKQDSNQSINQESQKTSIQKDEKIPNKINEKELQNDIARNGDSIITTPQPLKKQTIKKDREELQENTSEDSVSNAESKAKYSNGFPLNIEG